jgi:hypothetical protein
VVYCNPMNSQNRIEKQVAALHAVIASRIRAGDPFPILRAQDNLRRWQASFGGALPTAYAEWVELLDSGDQADILAVLLGHDEDAVRRRSNSPFTGVLNAVERLEIMRHAA